MRSACSNEADAAERSRAVNGRVEGLYSIRELVSSCEVSGQSRKGEEAVVVVDKPQRHGR